MDEQEPSKSVSKPHGVWAREFNIKPLDWRYAGAIAHRKWSPDDMVEHDDFLNALDEVGRIRIGEK